jgi:23S rRNA pseudouridine955/2504/2580 synthase
LSEQPEGQIREGVRHVEVTEDQAGVRLDNFLTKLLVGVPRSRVFRIVRKGEVRVNGKRASPETRLQSGDKVRVPPVSLPSPDAPPAVARVPRTLVETVRDAIIIENERLIVVNKPAGIAVHGGSGVSFGIIGALHAMMRDGQVEKGYLALVKGPWDLGKKRIDVPLNTDSRVGGERTVRVQAGGKTAVSTFSPVQFFRNKASLVEVDLDTGRTHQIRVHAAHVGHPVAGDDKYGDKDFNARMREEGLERMFLHSHRISFDWPNGGDFSASAPLPADLAAVLDALGESTSAKSSRRRR